MQEKYMVHTQKMKEIKTLNQMCTQLIAFILCINGVKSRKKECDNRKASKLHTVPIPNKTEEERRKRRKTYIYINKWINRSNKYQKWREYGANWRKIA